MLCGWIVALIGYAALGVHPGNLDDLRGAVAAGQVRSVTVTGEVSPNDASLQEVTWRQWGLRRSAEVQYVPAGQQPPTGTVHPAETQSSVELGADLQRLDPALRVTRVPRMSAMGFDVLGSRVPDWVAALYLTLTAGSWLLLLCPATVWRATRWAWIWVWLVPAAGPIAVALLSGPVAVLRRRLPPPLPRRRVLTGGKAAFAALLLCSLLT